MNPDDVLSILKTWSVVAVTVFTALVTGCSFLLRMIASYIKFITEYRPEYKPSNGLVSFMDIVSAVSQNSVTAATIVANRGSNGSTK